MQTLPTAVTHLVVGAGFAGLGMAIALTRPARPTSSSSSGPTTSAAPGGTTPTPAPPATCPVQPLLVLLRAQPRLAALLLRSSRRSSAYLQPRRRRESGVRDRVRFGTDVERRRGGTTSRRSAGRSRPPAAASVTAPRCSSPRPAALSEPRLPDIAGHRHASPGERLPLRPLGPRRRPHRQAGRRHRHRRVGDPGRARDPAEGGRPRRRLPAHRRPGWSRAPTAATAGSSGCCTAASRPLQKAVRTATLLGRESYVPGLHQAAAGSSSPVAAGRAAQHRPQASPTPRCGQRSPRTTRSAASAS